MSLKRKLKDLKAQMQTYIEKEYIEHAINIRDEIRTIEKDLQILHKEGE